MSLPPGVKIGNCIVDPHRRPNHVYCTETEQSIHVDADTFSKVAAQPVGAAPSGQDAADHSGKTIAQLKAVLAEMGIEAPAKATKAALVALIEAELDKGEDSSDQSDASGDSDGGPDIEELRKMAADLGVEVPEGADQATLEDLIKAAIESE